MRAVLAFLALLGLAAPALAAANAPLLRIEPGTHTAAVRALAVDAAEQTLLTVSDDKTARLWRLPQGEALAVLRPPIGPGAEGKLYAAALSPDGRSAAIGGYSASNDVYLFDTRDGRLRFRLAGHANVIDALAFSPDGRLLAVCLWGANGLVLYRGNEAWTGAQWTGGDEDYAADCYGLAFSADGKRLATAAVDGRVRLYDIQDGAPRKLAERAFGAGKRPHGLAFSPDGNALAVGFEDAAEVEVLHAKDLSAAFTPDATGIAEGNFASVAWSADGRSLFAAGTARAGVAQHQLRRWEAKRGGAPRDLVMATDSVTALLALKEGELLFATAAAAWGRVKTSGEVALAAAPPVADFRLSRDRFGLTAKAKQLAFGFELGGRTEMRFDLKGLALRAGGGAERVAVPPLTRVSDWQDALRPRIGNTPIALDVGELTLSAAEDVSHQKVALGSSFHLRLFDAQAKPLWKVAAPAPCFAIALSPDGRWVLGGFGDGTVRWFEATSGRERLAFFAHADRRRWVLWTPEGRFAASEGGGELVGWQINRGADAAAEFLPFDRFSKRNSDPAGIAAILAGEPPARPVNDVRAGMKLPPAVRILAPREGQSFNDNPVRVEIAVDDRGGGIEELRLFHNGKRIPAPEPGAKDTRKAGNGNAPRTQVFELALEKGDNELRALALGKDHTESEAKAVKVGFAGATSPARLFLVVAGVNRYKNAALNLDYSVPDAKSVATFFRGLTHPLFEKIVITELYDAEATKAGLLSTLEKLPGVRPADVVAVYLAGHGQAMGEEWYFIPHDAVHPERDEDLKREGVSSRELAKAVTQLPARKVMVMIDACKSGAAIAGFRGLEERRALAQLSRATGTHLVAATTKDQLASEVQALGHGVFTYTLLEGLKGKAAGGGRDVTARKLISYVEQALPEISLKHRTEEQFPVAVSRGMDFPLTLP